MQCPFCNGVPPLAEISRETPHIIQNTLWFEAASMGPGPLPAGVALYDFNGVLGTELAVTFQEKKKGGAILTAHYCLTEGDTVFTLKSRVPLTERDRDALFGFMKDSLRIEERRGRKPALNIQDIAAYARQERTASLRRIALHFGVDLATVRRTMRAAGKTLKELRNRN
ncbi:MAG TPA: hypothetical protein VFY40_19380 [Blastocatellia bacterium]|nr:hypothetical protein [Blastocatellia bacterium]